jgi:hypothetical protein
MQPIIAGDADDRKSPMIRLPNDPPLPQGELDLY